MAIGTSGYDWVWMNGEFVPAEEATVHVQAHALHYGTGVFEGIRVYDGDGGPAVFRHRDHYERFQQSAGVLGADLPYDVDELVATTRELVARNDLADCYVRPTAFWGAGSLGLNPTDAPLEVVILAIPASTHRGTERAREGQSAFVPSWRRYHSSMLPTTAKVNGGYVNLMLAERDANVAGGDWAILLDRDGDVAEASGANIFLVRDGALVTPGRDASILDGVTRRTLLELAADLGIEADVRRVSTGELYAADEVFVCGTASEVTPITQIGDSQVGDGVAGPVTRRLQEAYYGAVFGEDDAYDRWLDPVGDGS
jgi:branched-chain amino acid aminotransferase